MKRRDFFKSVTGIIGVAVVAPLLLSSLKANAEGGRGKKAGAASGSDMLDVKDPTAQAVKYVETSKVKGKNCGNCVLYAKTGMKNGKEIGTCSLFPKKFVYAKAYCNSYAKKS